MNNQFYEQLQELVNMHEKCTSDGEEIFCFKLIKSIIDGEKTISDISESKIKLAQKQLNESFEWFEIIGVSVEYKEELMKVIS